MFLPPHQNHVHTDLPPTSFFFSFFFPLFRVAPKAYGSFQARGQIGAAAARHSHTGCKPLTAMPDPELTERGQESNLHPHGYQSVSFPLRHNGNSSPLPLRIDFSELSEMLPPSPHFAPNKTQHPLLRLCIFVSQHPPASNLSNFPYP